MTVPNILPVLGSGSHTSPTQGACVMEYVSLLAGEPWSDSPSCTHPLLAAVARNVNDSLPDAERHKLVPLIGRLFGTSEFGTDLERQQLTVRLAVWCARQVQHLVREKDREVCAAAINAAENWADDPSQKNKDAAANAANAANAAANAANAAANAAAYAAIYAAYDAAAAAANARLQLLTGLLDEYDRLTGRTEILTDAPEQAQALFLCATGKA